MHRGWELSEQSLRYGDLRHGDAVYVAAAERHHTALLTADGRIDRSGTLARCQLITVTLPTLMARGTRPHSFRTIFVSAHRLADDRLELLRR